jgi:hypothetical protein
MPDAALQQANPIGRSGLDFWTVYVDSRFLLGHSKYSFQVESDHRIFLWRFSTISAITFLMNGAASRVFAVVAGFSHTVSFLIAIPLTNYLCNRFLVVLPGLR